MSAITSTAPSPSPGMGAVFGASSTTFRVWAPDASAVWVAGDFTTPTWGSGQIALARDSSNPSNEGNNYWSVSITGVPAGAQYKFFIQNDGVGPGNPGGAPFWKLDPYCSDATSSTGNSIVVNPAYTWTTTSFQMPSFNELVIYELHIGTFNAQPGVTGTFADAIGKLNYLQVLGINAIEVMPAENFDTEASMGYNPCLPFAIDDAYGTSKAVQQFVDAAHALGIAVIFDVVYNHFGPEAAGMGACLWQFDGWSQNNYGGIYLYNDNRASCPWGQMNRPDFGRPEVRQYLRDNAMMWLNQYHADGLRLDSVINIRDIVDNNSVDQGANPQGWEFLQFVNNDKNASVPWTITIAEDLQNNDWITYTTGAGGAGFDAQWDATFRGTIRNTVATPNDSDRDMNALAAAIGKSYSQAGMFQRIVYAESHDEADVLRLPDVIWQGNATSWVARKRSTLAAAIVVASPGIPMIFMGEEFLSWGTWSDTTPLNWPQAGTYSGIVDLYTQLFQLRRNWNNNTRGLQGSNINIFQVDNNAKVIAFHRWNNGGPGDDVIVVANFSTMPIPSYNIGFPQPGTWYLRFNSDWQAYCSDFTNVGYDTTAAPGSNQNMPNNGNVGIGPYSCCFFSQ
jgi:1,4-alpha-glucan branching enzyme